MTTKETNSELDEVLNYKLALLTKINDNTNEISRLDRCLIEALDYEQAVAVKSEIDRGNAIISTHVAELSKLTSERIAKQLHIKVGVVDSRLDELAPPSPDGKVRRFNRLSAKQQKKIYDAIERSRQRDSGTDFEVRA